MNSSASERDARRSIEHVQHLRAHRDVEHRDRLVADQPVGVEHERGGDRHALALAARQLVRVAVGEALGRQADVGRARASTRVALGGAHALHEQRLGHDRAHAHARVERLVRVLEDHLHAPAQRAQHVAVVDRRALDSIAPPPPAPARASRAPASTCRSPTRPRRRAPRRGRHSNDTPSTARATPRRGSARAGRGRHQITTASPARRVGAPRARSGRPPRCPGATSRSGGSARGRRRRRTGSAGGTSSPRAPRPDRAARPGSAPPRRARRRSPAASRAAASCTGAAAPSNTSAAGPLSTIRPAYMTASRSHVSASTARSWLMRISASPSSRAQPREQVEHLRLHDHVERGGRLVGDHQRRPARERERDHRPLALAARELVRVGAPVRAREPDRAQQLGDRAPAVACRALRLVQPDRLGDLALDALHRVERVHGALEDQRDVPPAHELHAALGAPVDLHRLLGARRIAA